MSRTYSFRRTPTPPQENYQLIDFITRLGTAGKDSWLLLASDGLFANEERGGGGGLSNLEVASYVTKNAGSGSIDSVLEGLISAAQEAGSTDDITIILLRLSD